MLTDRNGEILLPGTLLRGESGGEYLVKSLAEVGVGEITLRCLHDGKILSVTPAVLLRSNLTVVKECDDIPLPTAREEVEELP